MNNNMNNMINTSKKYYKNSCEKKYPAEKYYNKSLWEVYSAKKRKKKKKKKKKKNPVIFSCSSEHG